MKFELGKDYLRLSCIMHDLEYRMSFKKHNRWIGGNFCLLCEKYNLSKRKKDGDCGGEYITLNKLKEICTKKNALDIYEIMAMELIDKKLTGEI